MDKIIKFIFFGNYFVGLLAVALNIEMAMQLHLPLNSASYYLLLFFAPIIYYTYAYNKACIYISSTNLRSKWYFDNKKWIPKSQLVIFFICVLLGIYLCYQNFNNIIHLKSSYWFAVFSMIGAALLYYGLLPNGFNLRNTGWLKAFIIGFVWACCANVLPLIFLNIEKNIEIHDPYFWSWLFIKNWMFCTVNAIIFDIKDYPTDANKHLKTFVVKFGLRKTIFFILIPLLCIGLLSLFVFAYLHNFTPFQLFFNVFPFLLTLCVAYSMYKRKNILFYLIVIDGLILFKALCGIIGVYFSKIM
jgi:4-hydroxybenzoate polyprenyltransferase